jgi:ESX secretion system protein EccE
MSRTLGDPARGSAVAPEFLVTPGLLDAISPSTDRGGMILGCGPQDEPLSVSVLRPLPTRLVLVGGLYLARQVALRAMATGAWVVVATGRPAAWQQLVRAAGEGPDGRPAPLMQVRQLAPVELPRASEDAPLLIVHDGGAVPQELFPPRSPWQSTLYVLPYLHPQAEDTAINADLVLLQRLPVGQAQLAARMWRLPTPMAQQLATLTDDGVVALGPNLWLPLRLVTTPAEREILGPVRRGD